MSTMMTRPAASRRNSAFARAAVFTEFRGRDARAIDQGNFVDRAPDQTPHRRAVTDVGDAFALDQLAAALLLDGDDADHLAA